ncbi:ion channel TACAN [Entelurus aequoreus]|uniref:ion channel TACAN n=1 Tax=Entelurus aequoreus TaxID=161455 RepID=UPI002B1E383B|nr:ion channel TACAN [Entelurus aequoreus]
MTAIIRCFIWKGLPGSSRRKYCCGTTVAHTHHTNISPTPGRFGDMSFSPAGVSECFREWGDIEKDYQQIQDTHRLYKLKLEEVTKLQVSCSTAIERQRKKLKDLSASLKECKVKHPELKLSRQEEESIADIKMSIEERDNAFSEMEAFLPKKNGLYLTLVLGNVNVTLLNKQSKFAYKDEYEKFKLVLTVILFLFSFTCRFLFSYRALDALFNFLLVWYYCTLTIRESILINNGSRIRGWWVFHHYVFTFLSGVMLTWPEGTLYQMFRNQFLSYCLYQSFVQFLQYYYQSGCLYRLRALGERHNMDLTVEGFQSWMWRGLTFLLPFLFFGHFWQLYNSVTLFKMFQLPECKEWQVFMCGCSYMVLYLGNFFTTLGVVYQKYRQNRDNKPKSL